MNSPDNDKAIVPQCRRCGTCCRNGGPALHDEDLELAGGVIPLTGLVTIRGNEPAFNQQTSRLDHDRGEFVKINGTAGTWTCLFWQENDQGCGIYENRPLECRLLFCDDTGGIERVLGRKLLTRKDIAGADDDVLRSIARHESACAYSLLNQLVAEFLAGPADVGKLEAIRALVRKDLMIRDSFFAARPDLLRKEMFLFGRPLFIVLSPYGFRAVEENNSISIKFIDERRKRHHAVII